MTIKGLAHQYLPTAVKRALRTVVAVRAQPNPLVAEYKRVFEALNADGFHGTIIMRPGVGLAVREDTWDAFQWFCWKSPSMVAEYNAFVEIALGRKAFLDVGCSHGAFALTFCAVNAAGRVVALDPSPSAQKAVRENITLNGYCDRLHPIEIGAGDVQGMVTMVANWDHLEARSGSEGVSVPIRPIDDICAELGFEPDLVKVDVEGFELMVLKGARRVLSTKPILFLEVHPELIWALKCSLPDVFDLLTSYGYEMFDCDDGGLVSRPNFIGRHHTFFTLCRPTGALEFDAWLSSVMQFA